MVATKLPIITNRIKIGKGALFFQPTGEAGAWRFGESSGFTINVETENFEYASNQSGLGEIVVSVPISTTRTAEITCDNMSQKVLEAYFAGSTANVTQTSSTVTGEVVGPVAAGYMYKLGYPTIEGGARKISAVTVAVSGTDFAISTAYTLGQILVNPTPDGHVYVVTAAGASAGTLPTFPTTLGATVTSGTVTIKNIGLTTDWVVETDYSYDADFGNFNIHEVGRVASMIALAVAASGTLSLKLGYARAAASTEQLQTGTASSLTGRLIYREEDPVNGDTGRNEWVFPKVTLTPGGELALITTEARSAVFSAAIQKSETLAAIYKNSVPV